MWKVFGSILNNKNKSNSINKIKINGTEVTEQKLIAEEFNKYFRTIGAELAENFNSDYTDHRLY